MKVLCIDTSGKEIGIGVFNGGKAVIEEYLLVDRNYNAVLLPLIKETLEKAGLEPGDIGTFCSTLGPGSFTGIRVGMATMKGFSQALGKPFFGASSLEVMASAGSDGTVWPVIDAGRGEIYTARFKVKNSGCRIEGKYMLMGTEAFLSAVKESHEVITLKREGLAAKLSSVKPGLRIREAGHISMDALAAMALKSRGKGGKKHLFTAAPVYIRPSEAEATLLRKKAEARKKPAPK